MPAFFEQAVTSYIQAVDLVSAALSRATSPANVQQALPVLQAAVARYNAVLPGARAAMQGANREDPATRQAMQRLGGQLNQAMTRLAAEKERIAGNPLIAAWLQPSMDQMAK